MNVISLVGRLTSDPELRKTKNNKSICTFCLAVDDGYGQDKKTDFINCVVWEKQAENLCQYQGKGNRVGVTGKLKIESYTDQNGNKKSRAYVQVQSIEYYDRKVVEQQTLTNDNRDVTGHYKEDVTFETDDLPFF